MTTFLGPVGSLVPVKCASTLTSSGGREVSFTRTLGKQKAFLGQVRAREWNVDIGLAEPGELSGLRWLAEYSSGPLVWYSPDAVVGNILPPDVAAFVPRTHNGLDGALVEADPGVHVKSVFPDGANSVSTPYSSGTSLDPIPIVPGMPVTISVWLRGSTASRGQVIAVVWRDIQGVNLGTDNPTVGESTGTLVRRSLTLIPPPGAAQITLQFFAEQIAGPAVTLTDRLMSYSDGRGAKRVVAHGLTDAVLRAYEDHQYQSLSFTVSEVG